MASYVGLCQAACNTLLWAVWPVYMSSCPDAWSLYGHRRRKVLNIGGGGQGGPNFSLTVN